MDTLKLVIFIANITYVTAIVWKIICEGTLDYMGFEPGTVETRDTSEVPDIFMLNFEVEHKNNMEALIMAVYFAFTSLSTVGFGDYHPRGDLERVCGAFILLIGVAVFSYIMGNFISILEEMKAFAADLEDADNLSKFFGTIKHYNKEHPIKHELMQKIIQLFDYRWKNDKLIAFQDNADIDILDQLPEEIQRTIYVEFLFRDFLMDYSKTFCFENELCVNQPSFFTWEDHCYIIFMKAVLS